MIPLQVISENSDYIIVNKTAGLISEKNPYETNTIEDKVLKHLQKTTTRPYIGVAHRLDRVTSGLLIFAKKKSTLVELNKLFSSRKVRKTYLAIVTKRPPKNKGALINFMVKNNLEKRADIVPSKIKDAQDCRLSYKLIDQNDFGYLLEIKPTTGRFHQIRSQLSHIGLPIIGDKKYGSDDNYFPLSICLHAWKLSYEDPVSKDLITFEAPTPRNIFWEFKKFSTA